jgi:hypothetical protein
MIQAFSPIFKWGIDYCEVVFLRARREPYTPGQENHDSAQLSSC